MLINQFEKHKEEITDLIYSLKYDYLISCSTDLNIKIHKDNEKIKENKKPIRELELMYEKNRIQFESKITKIMLKKMILNEEKGVLITCLSNGYIKEFEPVEKLYDDLMKAREKNKIVKDCSITLKHKEGELDI